MRFRHRRILAAAVAVLVTSVGAALVAGPKRLLALGGFAPASERLVTGILVTGTADRPVLYVTSGDPRIGGDVAARDLGLDTNSGVISRLELTADGWQRVDIVRGLPRSEENHATNGLALDDRKRLLYVAQGGMTNQGAPSNHFAYTPEYALSGAILVVDLARVERRPYDLPTLDDDTRPGATDRGDPFGGNDGKNQARLVPGGPVGIRARGFRNPYDVVLTRAGRLYTIDNGAAIEWGGPPRNCTNEVVEPGTYDDDTLHLITGREYFGGHANPTRANTANTFNRPAQSPVPRGNPIECRYVPARRRPAIASFTNSTNGLAEYTASNLGNQLRGDLLAVSFDRGIYRVDLAAGGDEVLSREILHRVAGTPLDVTAQGDGDPFPGTAWVADYVTGSVTVLEPADFASVRRWRALRPASVDRQEVSFVTVGRTLYLAGGATNVHEAYEPSSGTWARVAPLPEAVDHFQGVVVGGRIYYVGGLARWPEPEVGHVQVYDPRRDSFSRGRPMPRPRGAGGVAVHRGLIYYAGGLHEGEAVPWFDVYNPRTREWRRMPDMPRPRDHFQAVVTGERLYAIGGRDTEVGRTIAETDVFDFRTGRWSTARSRIPTPRGGYAAALVGDEIWILGGESTDRVFANVEAYDPERDSWRALDLMATGRHGIQAAVCGGALYIAAGGGAPYGERPVRLLEAYPASGPGCGRRPLRASRRWNGGVRFGMTTVAGTQLSHPTSLQFGPDARLYVSQQNGLIKVLSIRRLAGGRYVVDAVETIDLVQRIPNHNDDGAPATDWAGLVQAVRTRLGL